MGVPVLVLREAASAAETAEALRRRGHVPVLLAVERIEATDAAPPAGLFAAYALTSRHAAAPLARAFRDEPRPVLAVGAATAAAARAAGFAEVLAGEGSGEGLGALARGRLGAEAGPLLYAAGSPRTGTLERGMAAAGLGLAVWECYRTLPLDPSAEALAAALKSPPGAALVLSGGQAEGLARLSARLPQGLPPGMRLLCLSARIAAVLGADLRQRAEWPEAPSLAALLDRLS